MALYKVTDKDAPEGSKARLVNAATTAAVIRHVAGSRFEAEPIRNPLEAADLVACGHVVEHAKTDDDAPRIVAKTEPDAEPKVEDEAKDEVKAKGKAKEHAA